MYFKSKEERKKDYDKFREDDIKNLWKRCNDELVYQLLRRNLPVIETDHPGALHFCHIRYEKHGKIYSKWRKNLKPHKKWRTISTQYWEFYPIGIYPKKLSRDPKDQLYVFLVEFSSQKEGEAVLRYTGRIEVTYVGSILEELHTENSDPLLSLPKFPKSMFSKLNHCLFNNFLPDLWMEEGYAKWHRSDRGILCYMLTYHYERKSYKEPLLSLLHSNCGGEAAILLAFTCFSVMKNLFPQYRSLDKTSSYLQAKKYIPKQIAINIQSDSLEAAVQLANLCCGCFDPDAFYTGSSKRKRRGRKLLIRDGIIVQYSPKGTYLSVDSFEATLLQSACVLWVNRKPAEELIKSGKLINIHLHAKEIEKISPFCIDLIEDWTHKINIMTVNGYFDMLSKDREMSIPEIEAFLIKTRVNHT